MGAADAGEVEDRDVLYRRHFDRMQRAYLRSLVCDEAIREHAADPLGQHTEPLERLLHYFRNLPLRHRYAIRRDGDTAGFRVVALSGVRGEPPRPVDDTTYATLKEAYHGIFLRQIDELVSMHDG